MTDRPNLPSETAARYDVKINTQNADRLTDGYWVNIKSDLESGRIKLSDIQGGDEYEDLQDLTTYREQTDIMRKTYREKNKAFNEFTKIFSTWQTAVTKIPEDRDDHEIEVMLDYENYTTEQMKDVRDLASNELRQAQDDFTKARRSFKEVSDDVQKSRHAKGFAKLEHESDSRIMADLECAPEYMDYTQPEKEDPIQLGRQFRAHLTRWPLQICHEKMLPLLERYRASLESEFAYSQMLDKAMTRMREFISRPDYTREKLVKILRPLLSKEAMVECDGAIRSFKNDPKLNEHAYDQTRKNMQFRMEREQTEQKGGDTHITTGTLKGNKFVNLFNKTLKEPDSKPNIRKRTYSAPSQYHARPAGAGNSSYRGRFNHRPFRGYSRGDRGHQRGTWRGYSRGRGAPFGQN